jgi:hypothetical protein
MVTMFDIQNLLRLFDEIRVELNLLNESIMAIKTSTFLKETVAYSIQWGLLTEDAHVYWQPITFEVVFSSRKQALNYMLELPLKREDVVRVVSLHIKIDESDE